MKVISNPPITSYLTYSDNSNVGDNTSVAPFMRCVGVPASVGVGDGFGYNCGDDEILNDWITTTEN